MKSFWNSFRLWFKYRVLIKIGKITYKISFKMRYWDFCQSGSVVLDVREYEAVADFLAYSDFEMFLKRVADLTDKRLVPLRGRALFIPELDELTRKASLVITPQRRRQSSGQPTSPKTLVYVATSVDPAGGPTRVIEDIAATLPDYQHALVITSMQESDPNLTSLRPHFGEVGLNVHLLQASCLTEKTKELSALIAALKPQAVMLLAHHQDSIAYAGVTQHAAPRVLFLHHADHQPSLGASRFDYTHIDLTPGCHDVCVSHTRLHASLLNLTTKDIGTVQLVERHPIIGVTCGTPHKYAGSSEFSYAQLLGALFSAGVDQVFHIGYMPEAQKDEIRADIVASGQDADRIIFLPDAPSLSTKLMEIAPDFYLTSHPLGGGKANVEALSVGLPILWVCPASTPRLLCPDMTFDASVHVSTLEQIPAAIHRLEIEKSTLARRSREIYEKFYSPKIFRERLLSAITPDQ